MSYYNLIFSHISDGEIYLLRFQKITGSRIAADLFPSDSLSLVMIEGRDQYYFLFLEQGLILIRVRRRLVRRDFFFFFFLKAM